MSSATATPRLSSILGLSRDQLRGRQPGEVIGPAADPRGRPLAGGRLLGDAALTDGCVRAGLVARLTRPDGTPAWVSVSSGPVLDAARPARRRRLHA